MGEGTLLPVAIVIRGGMSKTEDLARSALTCFKRQGYWGLTFWSWPDMTAEEIAMRVKMDADRTGRDNPLPHPVMRASYTTFVSDIGEGVELRQTGPDGHQSLILPLDAPRSDWTASVVHRTLNEWWTAIERTLSAPVSNPVRRGA